MTPVNREHSDSVVEGGWLPLNERQQRTLIVEAAHAAAAAFSAAGWQWGGPWNGKGWDEGRVPTEDEIALRLAELADCVEMDSGTSTGRLRVERYIEDGREVLSVSLDLGSVHGEEPK